MLQVTRLADLTAPPRTSSRFVVDAWGMFSDGPSVLPKTGEGRRLIKELQESGACCRTPTLAREDGYRRFFCRSCGLWWSASHTSNAVVAARCSEPVGIDVQRHVQRPAAMRWLARITQVQYEPSINHWAVAEAYWKAGGNAHRRPAVGEFDLPHLLAPSWGSYAFDGSLERDYWVQQSEGLSLAVVIGPVSESWVRQGRPEDY